MATTFISLGVTFFLLTYFSIIGLSSGLANTTIYCLGKAVNSSEASIICLVSGKIESGIVFIRKTKEEKEVVKCNYFNTFCTSKVSGYSAKIRRNVIRLTIQKFRPEKDSGLWICRDGPTRSMESMCRKSLTDLDADVGALHSSSGDQKLSIILLMTASFIGAIFIETRVGKT